MLNAPPGEHALSDDAERKRRQREREDRGLILVRAWVPAIELTDRLIAAGLINDDDDRKKINAAVQFVLRTWCGVTRDDVDVSGEV
jgi:hypothetical protein